LLRSFSENKKGGLKSKQIRCILHIDFLNVLTIHHLFNSSISEITSHGVEFVSFKFFQKHLNPFCIILVLSNKIHTISSITPPQCALPWTYTSHISWSSHLSHDYSSSLLATNNDYSLSAYQNPLIFPIIIYDKHILQSLRDIPNTPKQNLCRIQVILSSVIVLIISTSFFVLLGTPLSNNIIS